METGIKMIPRLNIPLNSSTLSISILLVNIVIIYHLSNHDLMITINKEQGEGRIEHAVEICKKALTAHPDDFGLAVMLGEMYSKQGKYKDAFNELEKALKMRPRNVWALKVYGNVYAGMKDYDRAMDYYNKALKENIDEKATAWVYHDLAQLYLMKGDKKNALRCEKMALGLAPDNKAIKSQVSEMGK
ncbi:MAG: tetratricopeptide repeat protein [Elusimicrobia bacterium]|nr:tetratricopeptide repeat protein [Candidatus Liberimonas magnetica]